MSSIRTNLSAMGALQTLRTISSQLGKTQDNAASGFRVAKASDNAAYWSIATTMRSDNSAISAVSDALGLGASTVDVAYEGMSSVVDLLGQFKSKLVTAEEDGVDKTKVQADLDQIKQQIKSIANSSSFSGVNYLSTDIDDIYDGADNKASVVSSFVRDSSGNVSVKTAKINLDGVSLFNSTGGGILQADPRDVGTIGGLRFETETGRTTYGPSNSGYDAQDVSFTFTGPITLGASDSISFDVTVDADNPAEGLNADNPLPAPYNPGATTSAVITKATVDAALGTSDGVINNYTDYTAVLKQAIQDAGGSSDVRVMNYSHYDPPGQTDTLVPTINEIGFISTGASGLDGSSIEISNVNSTLGTAAGLSDISPIYGVRRSGVSLDFQPFKVYEDVVISFSLYDDTGAHGNYEFNKDTVNAALGETNGEVNSAADMAKLLNAVINRPDLIIEDNGNNTVGIETRASDDRKSGASSYIGITGVSMNLEPLATKNLMDIDVATHPDQVSDYLSYIDLISQKAIQAAATLGSVKDRIGLQSNFANTLMDSVTSGVGKLVDADMEETSTRLSALQTQQQLALQSLSIANSAPQSLLSLFQA